MDVINLLLIFYIALGLLGTIIYLLLQYMVIRLAITHGMLSYSRQLRQEFPDRG